MASDIFYVYRHVEPKTGETVYVGKGCYGRAWDVTRNRSSNPAHVKWCKYLCEIGFTPDQYVVIDRKGLPEPVALDIEKNWLHSKGRPVFNRQSGERNYQAKITDHQAREIFIRSRSGENHGDLAEEFSLSRSAVSMISSRKQWRAATACLI